MNARAFLIRGLIAGLIAGLAAFFVGYLVGEPHIDTAIALEDANSAADEAAAPAEEEHAEDGHAHVHGEDGTVAEHAHEHGEGGTVVSRESQSTWGLLTGTVAMGLALGGLVALVVAGVAGRIGRLSVRQTSALVSLLAYVSCALVPFLKYPATPPAVGNGDTIGHRTAVYFGFLLVSLLAAIAATVLATRLAPKLGWYAAVVSGIGLYLAVVVIAAVAFPTVNEIGDFPADTLWYFRVSSLLTIATLWGTIGVVLTGLLGRLEAKEIAVQQRREFAAAL